MVSSIEEKVGEIHAKVLSIEQLLKGYDDGQTGGLLKRVSIIERNQDRFKRYLNKFQGAVVLVSFLNAAGILYFTIFR